MVEGWKCIEDGLYTNVEELPLRNKRVACFDMDGTLIKTQSGKKFPKDRNDWEWLYHDTTTNQLRNLQRDGFTLVVFTNQSGCSKNEKKLKEILGKCSDLATQFDFHFFVATRKNKFRKPHRTMWDRAICSSKEAFYCGDAAGRPDDFACSDRQFAANIGVMFHTPEEYFLRQPRDQNWKWPDSSPSEILKKYSATAKPTIVLHDSQEMILLCGMPASGKSRFAKTLCSDYTIVSSDLNGGNQKKTVKQCEQALQDGKSVVVDNTNYSKAMREQYLILAKKHNIQSRCFIFDTPPAVIRHLNLFREMTSDRVRVPDIAYNMLRSKFVTPTLDEGFTEIAIIPFHLDVDESQKEQFLQWC